MFERKKEGIAIFSTKKKNKIIVVQLNDNSIVTFVSTFGKIHPVKKVYLYSRIQKKKVFVPQPHLIEQDKTILREVGLCDNLIANYRL